MPEITDHWPYFLSFCKLEKELRGPDPQLVTTYQMSRNVGTYELMWRAGLLVGTWNVPTAEAIWSAWPIERVTRSSRGLEGWLTANWAGILTRQERRCVRTPAKLAKYLTDYAAWIFHAWEPERTYDAYWKDVQDNVKFMGRYVTLKLLEFFNKYVPELEVPTCPDIRADGGWSPVNAMKLIFPELEDTLEMAQTKQAKILIADINALRLYGRLRNSGVDVNFFELQVMLCEYRTCYERRHQYPGRSLDEELEFMTKSRNYWKDTFLTTMYGAREIAFHRYALGEWHSWRGIRHTLGTCLRDQGYMWSDLVYDFEATNNLAEPVRRT